MTITIPRNPTSRIQILAKSTQPKNEQTKHASQIGVSINEAAALLGVSKMTFLPLIKDGQVRTARIGKRVIVSVKSLHEFVDGKDPQNSVKNTAELQGEKE